MSEVDDCNSVEENTIEKIDQESINDHEKNLQNDPDHVNPNIMKTDMVLVPDNNSDSEFENFISTLSIDDLSYRDMECITDSSDSDSSLDSDDNDDYDNADDNDSNDIEMYVEDDDEEETLKGALCDWYRECGSVGRDHLSDLLKLLRNFGHPELPKDSRAILNTPRNTVVKSCPPGEYFHYGIREALSNILSYKQLDKDIVIDINVDGLLITKSTNRTLWPILGKLVKNPYIPWHCKTRVRKCLLQSVYSRL